MITIKRNGLKLTCDSDIIPAQGSSNVPVTFVNDDDEYASYIVQPSIGWFMKSGAFKATLAVFENNSFEIPAEAFLQDGQIYISIGLVDPQNANHIEKTLQLSLRCLPAPFGTVVLPDTDTWQKFVQSFTDDLFDSYTAEEVSPVLEQAQQAVQTANSASQTAMNTSNTINQAIQDGDFIPQISATATQGAEGSQPSVTVTGNKEMPTINFTIPKGDTGEQGPQGIQGIQGVQGPAGPSSVMMNGVTQNSIDLKGVGFYISDDDESVTIGTYDEWVAAGSPAFPSDE